MKFNDKTVSYETINYGGFVSIFWNNSIIKCELLTSDFPFCHQVDRILVLFSLFSKNFVKYFIFSNENQILVFKSDKVIRNRL